MMYFSKTKRIAKIIAALIFVLLSYQLIISFKHRGQITININVIPPDSTININGHTVRKRTLGLAPGKYKIEAIKQGFKTDSQEIELLANTKKYDLYFTPAPITANAKQWLDNNPQFQARRESYAGLGIAEQGTKRRQNYPLVIKLPQTLSRFRINYGQSVKYPSDLSEVTIYINATTPEARVDALNWIKENGYDPTGYEIVFSDFHNPFTKAGR